MNLVFYKGFAAEVINVPPIGTHIKLLKDFNIVPTTERNVGDEILAYKSASIESLVAEVFSIGDKVERINGTFKGTVVGFEYHSNSAVCVSEKIEKYDEQRTRYAYKVTELKKFDPQHFVFEKGDTYLIDNCFKVMAVESVFSTKDVMLFDTSNGSMRYRDVAIHNTRPKLKELHGITNIEKI